MMVDVRSAKGVNVTLQQWEVRSALQVGTDRATMNAGKAKDAGHYDGRRMEKDYERADQLAALCEIAVAKATNQFWSAGGAWSPHEHHKFKKLADVGKWIEVRRVAKDSHRLFSVGEGDRSKVVFAAFVSPSQIDLVKVLGWAHGVDALAVGQKIEGSGRLFAPISILKLEKLPLMPKGLINEAI